MDKKIFIILSCLFLFILIVPLVIYLIIDRRINPPIPTPVSIIPRYDPDDSWEKYSTDYIAASGQLNAMEFYLNAYNSASAVTYQWPDDKLMEQLMTIIFDGWFHDQPEINELLNQYQYTIEQIINGAKLQYCDLPPAPGYVVDRPDLIRLRFLAMLIAVQAKLYQRNSQYDKAVECYLAGLQFGNDIAQKNQDWATIQSGLMIFRLNLTPLLNLISAGNLSDAIYRNILQELIRLESEQIRFDQFIESKFQILYREIYHDIKSPLQFFDDWFGKPGESKYSLNNLAGGFYIFLSRGHILRDNWDFNRNLITVAQNSSYAEFIQIDWENRVPDDPFNEFVLKFGYNGMITRHLMNFTYIRLGQIESALQLYRLKNKKYPGSMNDIHPVYLAGIPKDLYTGSDFIWKYDNNLQRPVIYSFGPDLQDDLGQIIYDPSNGIYSSGDIFLEISIKDK